MQRPQSASGYIHLTDEPSGKEHPSEAAKSVPDSFAEWLAHPAGIISASAESEPESDDLMPLLAQYCNQNLLPPSGLRPSL